MRSGNQVASRQNPAKFNSECLLSTSTKLLSVPAMSYNYIVTAYKPTAVTAALTGNFTGPKDLNLIEAKGSYLVVNLVTPEGLKPIVDVNIYGRITIMQLFRPKVDELLF